jgi:hypothetical protein
MSLKFFDTNFDELSSSNPLWTAHNGYYGDASEVQFFVRNDSANHYYEQIQVQLTSSGSYDVTGEYGTSGWSFKLVPGSRRPTEKEWDAATNMAPVTLGSLGDTDAGDTTTLLSVWLRVFVPGRTPAQYRNNYVLSLSAQEKVVGS